MTLHPPYLLFLGDAPEPRNAKTAQGVFHWAPEKCLAQLRLPGCSTALNLPEMTPAEAAARGARTMIVGVANHGGVVSLAWRDSIIAALEAGMDVASGLHDRMDADPLIAEAAARTGRRLLEARHPKRTFGAGTGAPRTGHRLLTVGTDCSVGKMYTSLALAAEMKARGFDADFRATGQTGIFIAGDGVPVDAVVADFIAGAIEHLAPAAAPDHWDLIEGQGSLYHPAYAGVTLGLVHGAQPDTLVLCHDASRTHVASVPGFALPDLAACMDRYLEAASLTSAHTRFVGISLNTSKLSGEEARRVIGEIEQAHGLPTVDPVRTGVAPIVDALAAVYA